jgi:hypothetical protein
MKGASKGICLMEKRSGQVSEDDGANAIAEPIETSCDLSYVQTRLLDEFEASPPVRPTRPRRPARSPAKKKRDVPIAVEVVPKKGQLGGTVSIVPLKDMADRFAPDHPLRILLAGEPDDIPREEYASKLPGWYRLMYSQED